MVQLASVRDAEAGPDPMSSSYGSCSSTAVEDAATGRDIIVHTLPDFPAPTYRAALFTWMGSTMFIFALGLVVVPNVLKPGTEMGWPLALVSTVYIAMILVARRRSALPQLLGGWHA
jgi:hypothetical protein